MSTSNNAAPKEFSDGLEKLEVMNRVLTLRTTVSTLQAELQLARDPDSRADLERRLAQTKAALDALERQHRWVGRPSWFRRVRAWFGGRR